MKIFDLYRVLIFLLLLTSMNVTPLNMAHAEKRDLTQYLWENRVLLLFSPSLQDPRLEAQIKELKQSACDIQDRDTLVFQIITNSDVLNLNGSVSKLGQDRLRAKYRIQTNDYIVILLGKDGGEKLRSNKVIPANEIFNEIDAMPMRQNEMATRHRSCS